MEIYFLGIYVYFWEYLWFVRALIKCFGALDGLPLFFFQVGLIILLSFFWLSPGSFTAILYLYLMIGVFAFTSGAVISIFIAAIELVNKKILGVIIGAIIIFMYYVHIASIAVSGMIISILGWNDYFATVFFTGILATLVLWICRPLPS